MLSLINQYIVVLDACVLAPMPLCDTLLRLAEEPAFYVPRWSEEILAEIESTLTRIGRTKVQIDRRLEAMRAAFPEALVTGYEQLTPQMTNHLKDRHVLAAAVKSASHAIITANKKHFPESSREPYDIDLLSPDEFLIHQFHLEQELLIEKLQEQSETAKMKLEHLLGKFRSIAPEFVGLIAAETGIDVP